MPRKYFTMPRIILILIILINSYAFSQLRNGRPVTKGEIIGSVIDSASSIGMEYVSVALYKQKDSSVVTGVLTDLKGKFELKNVKPGSYYLVTNFVGYNSKFINNISITKNNLIINLGEILVNSDIELKELVVRGDIPRVTYEIDKKVVNVEDMTTTVGQSAVEVLQNTPSIQVDAQGNVTLRGSSTYQLLINGIPTAMDPSDALQAIPASTIKNIEIVTNPSAREQAEGVGGIINIITKKKKLEGASMLINISDGNFERYGGDIAINYSVKKHTLNLNLGFNQRNRPSDKVEERISDFGTNQSKILQTGEGSWKMGGPRIGGEWIFTPNDQHIITIGSTFGKRNMRPFTNSVFEEFLNDSSIIKYENRYSGDILITSLSNFISYRYLFNKENNEYLNFKAIYNLRSVDEYSYNDFYNENGVKTGGNLATEFGPSNVLRFDLDYVKKLKNNLVLESGLQAQFGLAKDDRDNFEYDPITGEDVRLPLFSTDVQYNRNVHAGYSLVRGKKNKLGYQFGLRAEYTFRNIEATTFPDASQLVKRLDWFPSAHFSYKLSDDQEILFSYSRRINRPRSYFFEPFVTWVSPYSVRTGNANLKPEYISSIEASWIKQLWDKGNISVDVYAKLLNNMINRIPSVYDTNIIIQSPENAGNSSSFGMDPTFVYYFKEWWNTNLALSLFYYSVTSNATDVEVTNTSFNWNITWINSFTFLKDYKLQVIGKYRSRSATPLGYQEERYGLDASLRKAFWENKLAITFQVSDILSTQRDNNFSSINNVTVYSVRDPFSPMYMVTVSLKLNNYKKIMSKTEQLDDF